jgi:hypothetical protein
MFAGVVAAVVAAVLLYIGIFGDNGLSGWGWTVAIALAAGGVAARLGCTHLAAEALLGVAEAVRRVVVHETARLHERVADGRSHEAKAAALELFAHRLRLVGL